MGHKNKQLYTTPIIGLRVSFYVWQNLACDKNRAELRTVHLSFNSSLAAPWRHCTSRHSALLKVWKHLPGRKHFKHAQTHAVNVNERTLSKVCRALKWSYWTAQCKGVFSDTSHSHACAPKLSRNSTASNCPFQQAQCRGSSFFLSFIWMLAP